MKPKGSNNERSGSHPELVALDFGRSGIKAVRLRRARNEIQLLGADILPPFPMDTGEKTERLKRLSLPPHLFTKYAALAINTAHTKIRLMAASSAKDEVGVNDQIREQVGADEKDRLASLPLKTKEGRLSDRRMAVAIPEEEIQVLLGLTASGPPAPYSLQAAGLATLNAFFENPDVDIGDDAAFLLDAGARFTFVYCLHKGAPVLLRRHDQGAAALVAHIGNSLGVDPETAATILCDGAVDISNSIETVMKPLFKQLSISRDFVERQEKCGFRALYLSGGLSRNRLWVTAVENALGLKASPWNPFSSVSSASGAYPERLAGDEPRFASAVGAGLGALSADALHD